MSVTYASWFKEDNLYESNGKYYVTEPEELWGHRLGKHSDGISVHSVPVLIQHNVTPKQYISHPLHNSDRYKGDTPLNEFIGIISGKDLEDIFLHLNSNTVLSFISTPTKNPLLGRGKAHFLINTDPIWWPSDPMEIVLIQTSLKSLFNIGRFSDFNDNFKNKG